MVGCPSKATGEEIQAEDAGRLEQQKKLGGRVGCAIREPKRQKSSFPVNVLLQREERLTFDVLAFDRANEENPRRGGHEEGW